MYNHLTVKMKCLEPSCSSLHKITYRTVCICFAVREIQTQNGGVHTHGETDGSEALWTNVIMGQVQILKQSNKHQMFYPHDTFASSLIHACNIVIVTIKLLILVFIKMK